MNTHILWLLSYVRKDNSNISPVLRGLLLKNNVGFGMFVAFGKIIKEVN